MTTTVKWIIFGAVASVISIIAVSVGISVVTTISLLLATSIGWGIIGVAGTLLILSVITGFLIVGLLTGLAWKMYDKEDNFVLTTSKVAVSVLAVWYTAVITVGAGMKILASYAMSPWINGVLLFIFVLLFFWGTDYAVEQVAPGRKKAWSKGLVIAVLLLIIANVAPTYLRSDYYDTRTGESKVYITPSTGKIWWSKPAGVHFDPTTGEKLVVATKEQIVAARESRSFDNLFGGSDSSSAPANVMPVKWWDHEITIKPGQVSSVGQVKSGDQIRSYSREGHIILRDGHSPNSITPGVDMMTTFESFRGSKEVTLKAGEIPATVRYHIIRR